MNLAQHQASPGSEVRSYPSVTTAALISAAALVVLSFVFGPRFPIADSALFEYVGRALAHGSHLYTDLWDNKLPSIYYLNAAWWLLFGDDYTAHLLAESAISAATIVLFAVILRRFGVRPWPQATLAFSVLYLFAGGLPNQTEHYATPLILVAVLCAGYRRYALAACALAVASTFWVPAFAAAAVPIAVAATSRERRAFLAALIAAGVVLAAAFLLLFGTATTAELIGSWFSYLIGNYRHTNFETAHHRYLFPWLSPSYYVQTGLGVLLFTAATFWRRPGDAASRFAFWWSVASLVIVAALGKPSPHYFLPVYAPLIMLIATQQWSLAAIARRWYFALPAAACAGLMIGLSAWAFTHPDRTIDAISYTGTEIRRTYGEGAVAMLPWEAYLTSYATPQSRFFLARVVRYAADHDVWTRTPVVYVDDAAHRFNRLQPPPNLRLVCRDALTGPLMMYTLKPIVGMPCVPR